MLLSGWYERKFRLLGPARARQAATIGWGRCRFVSTQLQRVLIIRANGADSRAKKTRRHGLEDRGRGAGRAGGISGMPVGRAAVGGSGGRALQPALRRIQ